MDFARNKRGFCVGFAWNLIFFSFMREREGYKHHADCTVCVVKTKALISSAVTAKLICNFVFAYAYCWFFHAAAHTSLFVLWFKIFSFVWTEPPWVLTCTYDGELFIMHFARYNPHTTTPHSQGAIFHCFC